jgi:hypothetical protein
MAEKIAGIDVHKKVLMVVVMDAHASAQEVRLVQRWAAKPARSARPD